MDLMDIAIKSYKDEETSPFEQNVASEIIRRLLRKGIEPDSDEDKVLISSILSAQFVEAYHENDDAGRC